MDRTGFATFKVETAPHSTVAKLAGTRTFAGVDDGTLLALARNARLVDARSAGQTRAAPGRNPGLLVLLSGNAVVGTPDKVVELPGQGAVVGEEHVFGAASRCTVRLLGQATALAIPAEAVRRALEHSPKLAHGLMANLARREIGLVQRIECHASRRGPQRLGGFILRQLPARDAPQLMRLPAPKVIIASLLSMTKESLSRGLARLAAAALLSVRGRQLQVPAPWRLAEACDCPATCTACDGIACAAGSV
jgi:CRP-like cAMP-binding protein